MKDNAILVNLKCVQWAVLKWRIVGEPDISRDNKPKTITVHGVEIEPGAYAHYHPDYPKETCLERAKRLDLIDEWYPELTMQLSANHQLTYTGDRALELWDLWKAKIYGKKKDV
jgi:pyridoxine 5'-phosphate synthase PdxJ